MRFVPSLSCGLWGASPVPPTLLGPVADKLADLQTFQPPQLRRASIATSYCRPLKDQFSPVKRTRSLPSPGELAQRWNTYNFPWVSTNVRQMNPSKSRQKMADRLRTRIDDDAMQMTDDEWFSLTYSHELLENEDFVAVLEEAKREHEWKSSISALKSFVQYEAPQLFTMLLYNKKEEMLDEFCAHGMNDSMFPLSLVRSQGSIRPMYGDHSKKLKFDLRFAKDVCEWQWDFFVPELHWAPFDQPPLSPRSRLPYVKPLSKINRTDFSIVFQGAVHRDYIDLDLDGIEVATDEDNHPIVAVKQLLPTGLKKEASETFIQAEYQTLEILRSYDTPHLIKAIAFYKQTGTAGDALHFVFPWAEHGNLRQFWAQKIPAIQDKHYMAWVFSQLVGLADAIRTLHHESEQTCRHGDLKPENVLCFNASKNTLEKDQTSCIFVISDVGLSRIHDKSTALRSKSRLVAGETVAYAAPETALFPDLPTSRRYDIWSLGCLYLEFVIWLLFGNDGLTQFGGEIGVGEKGRFYAMTSSATLTVAGADTAELNPVVKKWIGHIRNDPRCGGSSSNGTAISRLVELVETRLLVVNSSPDPKDLKAVSVEQLAVDIDEQADLPRFEFRAPTAPSEGAQNKIRSQMARFASTGDERAYALEVCEKLSKIKKDADAGKIKWLNVRTNGLAAVSVVQPKPSSMNLPILSRKDSAGRNPNCLTYFGTQKFDDIWDYIPDEDAAKRLKMAFTQSPQQHEPSELCSRCRSLPLWSRECTFTDTARLLARSSVVCALCRVISRTLDIWDTLPDDKLHFFRTGSCLKFNNEQLPPIASLYTLPEAFESLQSNVQLGFPRLPDPGSVVHAEVLRQWIQDCDDNHHCLTSQDAPFLPTRLLFVGKHGSEQPRLVCETEDIGEGARYLALSHRWGSHSDNEADPLAGKTVCTYKRNISMLEKGIDESEFPPMYLDAIVVARQLGVDYIWIDSLCIIQRDSGDPSDEGEDWKKESERMEQVYRSAYVTIAASCSGSPAEHFLKTRPDRQCVTMKEGDALYYVCDTIDDFSEDVEYGELNKRGWVLQERALSRRTIYFSEKQTYWECGEGVRCETLTKAKNSKASFLGDANFPYSIPNYVKGKKIVLYQDLYERYSKLALSFDTDRPVAIRGLEKRLLRALNTKGKFGVLNIYLRRGLLWQRDTTLQRIDFGDSEQIVPSWSWMAYAGGIKYMNVPFGGADWDQWDQDIISPWKAAQDEDAPLQLEVLVRDLENIRPGALIFRDEPARSFEFRFRCVIVGSSNESNKSKGQVYYVLIVTPVGQEDGKIYERAGVGCLHKQQIVWDQPGEKAYLR